ncbi:methyltransferase domain-containing protein [Rhodomicrobium vannielii ATCC 17100]|uniref:methyltransferase domain-containing protein n=1 Tax=Rhodomicrobium vannielii TaxID=1069 RepID=UPI001918C5C7|nr:methyltransferase domain-containing protein [Rhodomicrobium vannielii ATCC 17100]
MKSRIARTVTLLGLMGGLQVAQAEPNTTPGGVATEAHAGHGQQASDGAFHKRFDNAAKWVERFDNLERTAWQKPDEVVSALGLKGTESVADIGAGTGYFATRIAQRVPEGKVFAADVEPDMVRYLGERAKAEKLTNIVPVQAGQASDNLPEPVDVVLLVNTYHHIGNRETYFAALASKLKPDGRLVIVDFKPDSPDGPPREHRVASEKAIAEMKAAGYALAETHDFLPRQYFLVFRRTKS